MTGLLGAQHGSRAVRFRARAALNVIKQQAGVRQQVCVDTEKLTGLPRTLPATNQQRLNLAVQTGDIRQDPPRWQPRMRLGKPGPRLVHMADRLISGVAGSDPRDEPGGITLRWEHRLVCGDRPWRAKQRGAGKPERPAIQLDIQIAWIVLAGLVTAYPPLDVLHARQPCTCVVVRSVPQPHSGALLAP